MPRTKQQLRTEIAAKRKALEPEWLEPASARVVENFQALDAFQSAKTVALYIAIGGEVNLETLFPTCWKLDKRTCIPVFNEGTKLYEMAEIADDTPCRIGHYGIREPISPTLVSMEQIDLIAVPGVAFDPQGNRLGRGGGHYDRLLDGFSGDAAAVAFDFQILPGIPTDAHDKPVQCIATESKILNI
ncbi:MAG: 5-formyltetrahydrofolate cyclo-ligase [Verrucomicrobia bacterium]|nr:5-formyltetrahydrofolate cyclo-ligase [Verrucomicrobiota bacterium]